MNWLRRLRVLLRPPVAVLPAPVAVGSATELCEAEWRQAVDVARIEAYQAGLAEGELRGRMLLAHEIEAAFTSDPITQADAERIRQRQVH